MEISKGELVQYETYRHLVIELRVNPDNSFQAYSKYKTADIISLPYRRKELASKDARKQIDKAKRILG